MRADRLIAILMHLQSRGRTSGRVLAEKLEVSERTIHRDMEALSAAGVPVYAERGTTGGWELSEGYRTNLTGMKQGEALSLLLSHSGFIARELGREQDFDSAILKLLASMPAAVQDKVRSAHRKILIDTAGWGQTSTRPEALEPVQEALITDKKLFFTYPAKEGHHQRTVMPLGLVLKGKAWYLVARYNRSIRIYRLSRMKNSRVLPETGQVPVGFDLERYWEENTRNLVEGFPTFRARLKVRSDCVEWLTGVPYVEVTELDRKKEWVEVEANLLEADRAVAILMPFGTAIEVIEPLNLRQQMRQAAEKIRRLYQ
ncbi:MAG TPA: transcriptional regulator [Leptospiraceae bacterium]|nr:transcriptional regulator [Spirochaetaceae bacterium]HBS04436.1 transcriptional regulator [Leptospiraceae bacterium]|tara:strand:- start:6722 stop:7666 length:945 start_codon:yes stop_codon:yes gene_type:complete